MANNILEMALERLERDFPPSSLSAWFDDATVVSFTDNRLILHSPVQFKKEFIDQKFIEPLQNALYEPVSYTHLDVYKRQDYNNVKGFRRKAGHSHPSLLENTR